MYSCPACGSEGVLGAGICRCGADISLLRSLDGLADAWFNKALMALASGDPGTALEWLSACCVANPTDAVARRAQAKVWAHLGRFAESRSALARAAAIDPNSPELESIELAIRAKNPARKRPQARRVKGGLEQ